ncbi:MAG: glycoside hydrolase family 2 TIM barrel-domain containing protein [Atopobiaceae bacterium]|nr:glycoside hydrolase family 2 TIM barrel-domain containing protein [Atopobiaceae bacterium]
MDLDIKRVLAAKPGEPEDVTLNPLTTPWGENLDERAVLQEYPRPRLARSNWTCLNGLWHYAIVESCEAKDLWRTAMPPTVWDGEILVPFSPEAALSGVGRQLLPTQLLWYRTAVVLGEIAHERRLLLHFGAVDYACACYVNGEKVAMHVGGYLPFTVDITDVVRSGANILELCVYDPSEAGTQLRGKQRLRRGNMWYTAQSGIWQTVWMEEVPERHITHLDVVPDADAGELTVEIEVSVPGDVLCVDVFDARGALVASADKGVDDEKVSISVRVRDPHLWDTNDPYLYGLRIAYGTDEARSYTAFRTVGIETDLYGVPRFCLNHRPLFVRGLLDQGYWPDGLMTAPSDEALVYDIEFARSAGFNMLRKHIKVESDRWYWHCDRLGMLVWQDMVSGGGLPGEWTSANIPTLVRKSWASISDFKPPFWKLFGAGDESYRDEWTRTSCDTVRYLKSHPCIASWVVFNESWGQFLSVEKTEELRRIDQTRPYVATSGWYDQGGGDIYAVHNYFRGMRVYRDPHVRWGGIRTRAFMIDEFGGLTCAMEGHKSVQSVYGYDTYEDAASWRKALYALFAKVDALRAKGLAGFVYTQLSDVEEETNGLLTYDRKVNKLTAE